MNAKRQMLALFACLLAACSNVYKSPPSSGSTANLSIQFFGGQSTKIASMFEDGVECRGGWLVVLDKERSSADLVILARTTTLKLGSLQVLSMGSTYETKECPAIVTFEPQARENYTLVHHETENGCHLTLHSGPDEKPTDLTHKLVRRSIANLSLPGGPNRPFCDDKYPQDSVSAR